MNTTSATILTSKCPRCGKPTQIELSADEATDIALRLARLVLCPACSQAVQPQPAVRQAARPAPRTAKPAPREIRAPMADP